MKLTLLALLISCSHMKSGEYIQINDHDTLDTLSHNFGVSKAIILNSNRGRSFNKGSWVFIPQNKGLIQLFQNDLEYADIANSEKFLNSGRLLWPVPSTTKISSHYGRRWGRAHHGIDIPGRRGANIIASDDGVVIYSGNGLSGYGNMTIVKHAGGIKTVYAHAKKLFVRKGQKVHRGQVIALLGNTGRSTGAHLHFEIRVGDKSINPIAYIRQSRNHVIAMSGR